MAGPYSGHPCFHDVAAHDDCAGPCRAGGCCRCGGSLRARQFRYAPPSVMMVLHIRAAGLQTATRAGSFRREEPSRSLAHGRAQVSCDVRGIGESRPDLRQRQLVLGRRSETFPSNPTQPPRPPVVPPAPPVTQGQIAAPPSGDTRYREAVSGRIVRHPGPIGDAFIPSMRRRP